MKVKVKFLQSIAGGPAPVYDLGEHSFAVGEVAEVHPDHAAALISGGMAEAVEATSPHGMGEQAKVNKPAKSASKPK